MLKTNIIASSITNLTDARYFAAWGVEAIGFNLNQNSSSFMPPAQVNAMKDWVSGPLIIGEFNGLQDKSVIDELIRSLELDAIQLGPFAPHEWKFDIPIYREVILSTESTFSKADHYILKPEGEALISNHDMLSELSEKYSCYLDFAENSKELMNLLETIRPSGFILRGGEEEKVGYKSFDEIDEIFEALAEE